MLVLAEWPITIHAEMCRRIEETLWRDSIEDWCEAMSTMDQRSLLDAGRAIVPIWTDKTLVSDANDALKGN